MIPYIKRALAYFITLSIINTVIVNFVDMYNDVPIDWIKNTTSGILGAIVASIALFVFEKYFEKK